jgi:predicted enzyme related to lactoylglutathione lyase
MTVVVMGGHAHRGNPQTSVRGDHARTPEGHNYGKSDSWVGAPIAAMGVPYDPGMAVDLFAGIAVRDFATAVAWYQKLFGTEPYLAHDAEAVFELAEHRSVTVEGLPDRAGHAVHTIFVDDFDDRIAHIAARGLEPVSRETYGNGVRKAIFRDADGNEIGFGGAPV